MSKAIFPPGRLPCRALRFAAVIIAQDVSLPQHIAKAVVANFRELLCAQKPPKTRRCGTSKILP